MGKDRGEFRLLEEGKKGSTKGDTQITRNRLAEID